MEYGVWDRLDIISFARETFDIDPRSGLVWDGYAAEAAELPGKLPYLRYCKLHFRKERVYKCDVELG